MKNKVKNIKTIYKETKAKISEEFHRMKNPFIRAMRLKRSKEELLGILKTLDDPQMQQLFSYIEKLSTSKNLSDYQKEIIKFIVENTIKEGRKRRKEMFEKKELQNILSVDSNLLHFAKEGKISKVLFLLEQGADFFAETSSRYNLFHKALLNSNLHLLKFFLEYNKEDSIKILHSVTLENDSLYTIALRKKDLEPISYLISIRFNPLIGNQSDDLYRWNDPKLSHSLLKYRDFWMKTMVNLIRYNSTQKLLEALEKATLINEYNKEHLKQFISFSMEPVKYLSKIKFKIIKEQKIDWEYELMPLSIYYQIFDPNVYSYLNKKIIKTNSSIKSFVNFVMLFNKKNLNSKIELFPFGSIATNLKFLFQGADLKNKAPEFFKSLFMNNNLPFIKFFMHMFPETFYPLLSKRKVYAILGNMSLLDYVFAYNMLSISVYLLNCGVNPFMIKATIKNDNPINEPLKQSRSEWNSLLKSKSLEEFKRNARKKGYDLNIALKGAITYLSENCDPSLMNFLKY